MSIEDRIAALETEFAEYTERIHPNIKFTEYDLNTVFREWMFEKLAELEESLDWKETRPWRG